MNLNPSTQINLFEHKEIFNQLYKLYKKDNLPNKILLSGEKGIGKSTLAYHLINFVLSENEEQPYDYENNIINSDNKSYKLIQNKSNPNFHLIDVLEDKKNNTMIDVKGTQKIYDSQIDAISTQMTELYDKKEDYEARVKKDLYETEKKVKDAQKVR